MWKISKHLCYFIACNVCIFLSEAIKAHEEKNKLWFGINTQSHFCQEEKWLLSFNSQVRFIKQSHPLNSVYAEPLIGYAFTDTSYWFGYRFTQHVYNKPSYEENRLIQQLAHSLKHNESNVNLRLRLEERVRTNQKQLELCFRQKLGIELPLLICDHAKPYISNELFLGLNKTQYTSHRFLNENRLFLGINYYLQKNSWWEIGYVSQYLPKRQNSHYQLNHILWINYHYR